MTTAISPEFHDDLPHRCNGSVQYIVDHKVHARDRGRNCSTQVQSVLIAILGTLLAVALLVGVFAIGRATAGSPAYTPVVLCEARYGVPCHLVPDNGLEAPQRTTAPTAPYKPNEPYTTIPSAR